MLIFFFLFSIAVIRADTFLPGANIRFWENLKSAAELYETFS